MRCFDCGLPDLHNGDGDGIGSCDCPRCEHCGGAPGCDCRDDDYPDWPDDVINEQTVETVTAFAEKGLL